MNLPFSPTLILYDTGTSLSEHNCFCHWFVQFTSIRNNIHFSHYLTLHRLCVMYEFWVCIFLHQVLTAIIFPRARFFPFSYSSLIQENHGFPTSFFSNSIPQFFSQYFFISISFDFVHGQLKMKWNESDFIVMPFLLIFLNKFFLNIIHC